MCTLVGLIASNIFGAFAKGLAFASVRAKREQIHVRSNALKDALARIERVEDGRRWVLRSAGPDEFPC